MLLPLHFFFFGIYWPHLWMPVWCNILLFFHSSFLLRVFRIYGWVLQGRNIAGKLQWRNGYERYGTGGYLVTWCATDICEAFNFLRIMFFGLLYRERYLYSYGSVIHKKAYNSCVLCKVPWPPDVPRYSRLGLATALQLRRLQPHSSWSPSCFCLSSLSASSGLSSIAFDQSFLSISGWAVSFSSLGPLDSLLLVYSQASCRSPTLHHFLFFLSSSVTIALVSHLPFPCFSLHCYSHLER